MYLMFRQTTISFFGAQIINCLISTLLHTRLHVLFRFAGNVYHKKNPLKNGMTEKEGSLHKYFDWLVEEQFRANDKHISRIYQTDPTKINGKVLQYQDQYR